jgi:dethiobiotin synthetase
MSAFFVTAAGTDVGKTVVTSLLCRQLLAAGRKVRALKPVISGFDRGAAENSDTGLLLTAQGLEVTDREIDAASPWRFKAPLSPDMAAAREGKSIDYEQLLGFCREAIAKTDRDDVLLIEGVGGTMVPLDSSHTVRDWIAALGIPAITVTGTYLGSLSHCLTAVESLRQFGVVSAALVVSESVDGAVTPTEQAATLGRFLNGIRILTLPRLPANDDWRIAPDLTSMVRAIWA